MSETCRLFIGSSGENRSVAEALQLLLDESVDSRVWDQGSLEIGTSALESLTNMLEDYDFGVFVFTPDDVATIKGRELPVVRDNVIFETGLFIGSLGRQRTFFLVPRDAKDLHLPSDLLGIIALTYDHSRFLRDGRHALGPVATQLKEKIEKEGPRHDLAPEAVEGFYRRTGLTYAYKRRREAHDHMLKDIAVASVSISMYSRVYVSELLKEAESFAAAIAGAVCRSDPGATLTLRHVSISAEDDQLAEASWREEDPNRTRWKSLGRYAEHLASSDSLFERLHRRLSEGLCETAAQDRGRLRLERAYLVNRLLPYSLLVIDGSIAYVSFYSLSPDRYGNFAPTMRLVCDGIDEDTWARRFLRVAKDIEDNFTSPGRKYPLT